jgi:DNA-binding NtrC family response regulator
VRALHEDFPLQGKAVALTEKESILIVDDQNSLCETLKRFLRRVGYRTTSATSAEESLRILKQERFDLVLTDVCMPDTSGIELMEHIQSLGGNESVVLMTAFATIDQAVEMMRRGATGYIPKPFQLQEVANTIEQALSRRRQEKLRHSFPTQSISASPTKRDQSSTQLIGQSSAMRQLFIMIERIAPTNSSVLISGATGTGKELAARRIHELSGRRNMPFIDINCSAIPSTLIEAEFFGHQRGTFTGADETRTGLFEEAAGGTVFLDEVDALDLPCQAKLLRVLQERQIRRIGGRKNIPVDVRIISATNKDLHQMIANGSFRNDLLYRLCVVPLHILPLSVRADDVPLLIQNYLEQHASQRRCQPKSVSPEAMKVLLGYDWPGNVRELENSLEYALAIGVGEELQVDDLPPAIKAHQRTAQTNPIFQQCIEDNATLEEVERRYVELMLERHFGHQVNTAAALGIDRRTLSRKLQQYGTRILKKEESQKNPIRTLF